MINKKNGFSFEQLSAMERVELHQDSTCWTVVSYGPADNKGRFEGDNLAPGRFEEHLLVRMDPLSYTF